MRATPVPMLNRSIKLLKLLYFNEFKGAVLLSPVVNNIYNRTVPIRMQTYFMEKKTLTSFMLIF